MRLIFLTCITMMAFAANSLLTRVALADGRIGPADFSAIRLASAAIVLFGLVWLRDGQLNFSKPVRWRGVLALTVYVIGFSFAYVSLSAGVGALILFATVQVTMLTAAMRGSEGISRRRLIGAAVAFSGLICLMWPIGVAAPNLLGSSLMILAGIGWGAYSILGKSVRDPTAETAANFMLAVPVGLVAVMITSEPSPTPTGIALGLTSGILTSGLGYALWYSILPRIQTSTAAIAQLTVPIIAAAAGVALIGEAVTTRLGIAAVLVICGVAASLRPDHQPSQPSRAVAPSDQL